MELIKFKQSTADPGVYVKMADTVTIVAVYVDDLILIARTVEEMQEIKTSLTTRFKMKEKRQATLLSWYYC